MAQPSVEKSQKNSLQVTLQKQVVQQKQNRQVEAQQDVANVLKKVQSQKIVANVSRPVHKNSDVVKVSLEKTADGVAEKNYTQHKNIQEKSKNVSQKFESYADFMDAQADKAAAKAQLAFQAIEKIEKAVEKVIADSADSIISKIESLPVDIVIAKPVSGIEKQLTPVQPSTAQVEKRPFIKMKRRPLSTDNQGVSGITRSSDLKKSQDVVDSLGVTQKTNDVE